MERCDFASVTAILRADLVDGAYNNQVEFVEGLFDAFVKETKTFFDIGLVSKWLNGLAKPSADIARFYSGTRHRRMLAETIEDAILPCLSDSAMDAMKVFALLIGDVSVSEQKKTELCKCYPCKSKADEAEFLADVLLFGMTRPFVAHDIRKPSLPPAGSLSPLLGDFVTDEGVPKPCHHFCGREKELAALHEALLKNGKVFLHGIAGIGKSEIAKVYAKTHRKEYTNILYFTYSGDLKRDIANLIFADDLADEDENERFRKHNRFLRTLREDTLLIVDNFNTTAERDAVLDVVLKYHCRVLFTTRSRLTEQCCVLVEEIDDAETLFRLAAKLYADAETNRVTVEQIIETVHRHTLAVELAARLLETGILEPQTILNKLRVQKASFDGSDKIKLSKDGRSRRTTYYDHIHTLFALFDLPAPQREIMTNLTLIPLVGIPARLFGAWMDYDNLNAVNELAELGFIQPRPGNRIALHPMMQEVTVSDLPPSITSCRTMLDTIRLTCLHHGLLLSYRQIMFQTVENAIDLAVKDDAAYYLLLLQDVIPYMETCRDLDDIKRLIAEIKTLLSDSDCATPKNRALLLLYQVMIEPYAPKAIAILEKAMSLFSEITPDNVHLVSNLHENLGVKYQEAGALETARWHMEAAIQISKQYGILDNHDTITKYLNYASLLCQLGCPEMALSKLGEIEEGVYRQGNESPDYACYLQIMGKIHLMLGDIRQGEQYLKYAFILYQNIWEDRPDVILEKKREMILHYVTAGLSVGKWLIEA